VATATLVRINDASGRVAHGTRRTGSGSQSRLPPV